MISETMGAAMYHSDDYSVNDLILRATIDSMTGVENRAAFYEKLRLMFSKPSMIGVLIVDMDGLKSINDTYGHRAGDEAIRELANRLKRGARAGDVVARLGGDEFGVVLSSDTVIDNSDFIVRRFQEILKEPFYFEGQLLDFGASIGFAVYPDDASDMVTLIDIADKRMYMDKTVRKVQC